MSCHTETQINIVSKHIKLLQNIKIDEARLGPYQIAATYNLKKYKVKLINEKRTAYVAIK